MSDNFYSNSRSLHLDDIHPPGTTFRFIGDIAQSLGCSPVTIRFYEREGLISPLRIGRFRTYGPEQFARLRHILEMRSMGLSLAKIKETLELLGSASISLDSKERYCKVLAGHLDELHERQQRILKEIEITRSRISELSEGAISMGDSRQIACPASF